MSDSPKVWIDRAGPIAGRARSYRGFAVDGGLWLGRAGAIAGRARSHRGFGVDRGVWLGGAGAFAGRARFYGGGVDLEVGFTSIPCGSGLCPRWGRQGRREAC